MQPWVRGVDCARTPLPSVAGTSHSIGLGADRGLGSLALGSPPPPPMLLPAALRGVRSTQGGAAAAFLGAAWRGLAGASGGGAAASSGGSGSHEGSAPAAEASTAEPQQEAADQAGTCPLHEHIISVDRSGLINPPPHSHDPAVLAAQAAAAGVVKEPETPLARHLRTVIQVGLAALHVFRCLLLARQRAAAIVQAGGGRSDRHTALTAACPLNTTSCCPATPVRSLVAAPSRWQSTLARC